MNLTGGETEENHKTSLRVAAVPWANFLSLSTSVPRCAAVHYVMIPVVFKVSLGSSRFEQ
jgi:hypothetical protein